MQITSRYQCGRLRGLDSRDGVLLLGETHFYEDSTNHFLVFHIGERDKVYNKLVINSLCVWGGGDTYMYVVFLL